MDRQIRNKLSFLVLLSLLNMKTVHVNDFDRVLKSVASLGEKAAFFRALDVKSDLYASDLAFKCLVSLLREYLAGPGERKIYDREQEIEKWSRHLNIGQREMLEFVGLLEEALKSVEQAGHQGGGHG